MGFPKQAGDVHARTPGNKSKSLVEGKVFVDLLECALLKGAHLSSLKEQLEKTDKSGKAART